MQFWSTPLVPLAPTSNDRGKYFGKNKYRDKAFIPWIEEEPRIAEAVLPDSAPITRTYYDAWQQVWPQMRRPLPDTGLVSNYYDPCPADRPLHIETLAYSTLFASLSGDRVPAASSLDNFYCRQFMSGEIPATLDRATGYEPVDLRRRNWRGDSVDFAPFLEARSQAAPLLAWVEWDFYLQVGDQERLALIHDALARHLRFILESPTHASGLYLDPEGRTGVVWNSQIICSCRRLADIDGVLAVQADSSGETARASELRAEMRSMRSEADHLSALVREKLWQPETATFAAESADTPVDRAAAAWALLAGAATPDQAQAFAKPLSTLADPTDWSQVGRVLFQSDSDPRPEDDGLVLVACHALRQYGHRVLAHDIALARVRQVAHIWGSTGSFWSTYDRSNLAPAPGAKAGMVLGALPALRLTAEFCIGLQPYAPAMRLEWDVRTTEYCGHYRYRFAHQLVSLHAEPRASESAPVHAFIECERPIQLVLRCAQRRSVVQVRGKAELTI